MTAASPIPPVDVEQAQAVRALFARLRTPLYGSAEHQPRLYFRSSVSSRVVCTCGAELGVVQTSEGMDRVKAMHAEHVASVTP